MNLFKLFSNKIFVIILPFIIYAFYISIIFIVYRLFYYRLKRLAERTKTSLDDFFILSIKKIFIPILLYIGVIFIIKKWNYFQIEKKYIEYLNIIIFSFFGIRFINDLIKYFFEDHIKKNVKKINAENFRGFVLIIRLLVWSLGIFFILDNLGFKISTVIAGLGISGVAVALGAQVILGDLFSYFAILFDRPFEIGDFIIINDLMGTVEKIGLKTTRVRSLGGEQLIFSNSDLTDSRVRNYKRMQKRRVVFRFGVIYDTPLSKLKEIPIIVKDIINGVELTEFDRTHFLEFGDFSLIFEVVYYVNTGDFNKYADIQESINLGIKEIFEKKRISFAYPTESIILTK